jgi:2-methylisocitrate lyase-like PEP mutase family enzyme
MSSNADVFRRLHQGPDVFLLPNCWDAGSAKLLESLGAKAVATTSAGVAWANGYPDGDALPGDRLVATVRAMVRVIRVPLTVDMEAGYSDDAAAVGEIVGAVVDAGAVGINLEDGAGSPELLAAKIAQVKRAAARRGVDLFVNARTDVYLRGLVLPPDRIAETIARAQRYREAGADGIFVPKVVEVADLREIVGSARLPVNVLAWPGLPPASELAALGVRRLTSGSALAQGVWGRATAVARAFLAEGRSEPLFEGARPYGEINPLFARD